MWDTQYDLPGLDNSHLLRQPEEILTAEQRLLVRAIADLRAGRNVHFRPRYPESPIFIDKPSPAQEI